MNEASPMEVADVATCHQRVRAIVGRVIVGQEDAVRLAIACLLAEWARAEDRPVAWVSLDGFDDDPAAFLFLLASAYGRIFPDGEALIAAAKGMAWESPRGPMSIDPETRDVVQTVYIRRVEKVGNELRNVECDKVENVKDPFKARMK